MQVNKECWIWIVTGQQRSAELPRWSLCFAELLVLSVLLLYCYRFCRRDKDKYSNDCLTIRRKIIGTSVLQVYRREQLNSLTVFALVRIIKFNDFYHFGASVHRKKFQWWRRRLIGWLGGTRCLLFGGGTREQNFETSR